MRVGERQPGRGDDSQQPARGENQGQGGAGEPPSGSAAEILSSAGQSRSRGASRAGLTTAVILGVAIVAGVAGLALLANSGGQHTRLSSARDAGSQARMSGPAPALRVISVTPGNKSVHVDGSAPVQISFSSKLASSSVVPAFTPAVPGQWQTSGSRLTFTPSAPFAPETRYTLRIGAGSSGLKSALGGVLRAPVVVRFTTASYSDLRLDEVLSQLGYLPMTFQPTSDRMSGGPIGGGVAGQQQLAYDPPTGSFAWESGYPASLRAQWVEGKPNVVLRGAVMAFQAQHELAINGVTSQKFWKDLLLAAATSHRNTVGYTYAIASEKLPETLTIWHNGHQVFRSLANTGIPIDPTAPGTFPVYLKYRFQIMQGTNPDGSHYADPVSFVSYFDAGEAVHYFPRGSYGFPQSLGCVELPYTSAERAWPYLTYGSLVTVTS
jgi:peptidoglycan hydrolase-like protein with peptidoglycan-binding domain